jgi:hypothetical protein
MAYKPFEALGIGGPYPSASTQLSTNITTGSPRGGWLLGAARKLLAIYEYL